LTVATNNSTSEYSHQQTRMIATTAMTTTDRSMMTEMCLLSTESIEVCHLAAFFYHLAAEKGSTI
jgi:hypothetical protein